MENVNAISEVIVPEDLALFLDGAITLKEKLTLGVGDAKLGAAFNKQSRQHTSVLCLKLCKAFVVISIIWSKDCYRSIGFGTQFIDVPNPIC